MVNKVQIGSELRCMDANEYNKRQNPLAVHLTTNFNVFKHDFQMFSYRRFKHLEFVVNHDKWIPTPVFFTNNLLNVINHVFELR